jgi:integrase
MLIDVSSQLWPETCAWRPMLVTAIFTGLRCSELRGLCWGAVDLDQGLIEVRQRADFKNTIGSPKSQAGRRTVPMSPMVLNTLRRWREIRPETSLGLVFPTSRGTIYSN